MLYPQRLYPSQFNRSGLSTALLRIPVLGLCLLFIMLLINSPALTAESDLHSSLNCRFVSGGETLIDAKAIRQDFKQLYKDLELAHYNLYANTTKDSYKSKYQELLKRIDRSMTEGEIRCLFQEFVATGNIAHAKIDLPIADFMQYRANGGSMLPLFLKIRDNRVFVDEYFGVEPILKQGQEITHIDDRSIKDWLASFKKFISADNAHLANTIIEAQFPFFLKLYSGEKKFFKIKIKNSNKEFLLNTISRDQQVVPASNKTSSEIDFSAREAKMLTNKIAYLRPGPFYNIDDPSKMTYDPTAFHQFIDQAFSDFNQAKARALVIDLRSNPGGDASFSDHMIAWFADRPFRFANKFLVKDSPQAEAANDNRIKKGAAKNSISYRYKQAYEKHQTGEKFEFPISIIKPFEDKRFDKPVYVLINRYSYSNAVTTAAIIQDYQFGIIIGEETADLATTYGAMEEFQLQNSAIKVSFPKALIVRPNGHSEPTGVKPDITYEDLEPFGYQLKDFIFSDKKLVDATIKLIENNIN